MRWAGHVAHIGKLRNSYKILFANLNERGHFESLDVDGRIILVWMLNMVGGCGLD
jgi:hypothetical protein